MKMLMQFLLVISLFFFNQFAFAKDTLFLEKNLIISSSDRGDPGKSAGSTTTTTTTSTSSTGVGKAVFVLGDREITMVGLVLFLVLLLLVVGSIPAWPYSREWGYFPSGLIGLILIIFVLLLLTGRITV